MNLKRIGGIVLGSIGLFAGYTIPAHASGAPTTTQVVITQAISKGYESVLTINYAKPLSAAKAQEIKTKYEKVMSAVQPNAAGPTGNAFLVCNQLHSFSDTNGKFTFQHACGGSTGPWGYVISASVCSIAATPINELGMTWTRNGTAMPRMAPHPSEPCGYQYHGTYNPEHDFDIIAYNDHHTFTTTDGGSADLNIKGSFYSAKCTNPSVCP
jgi:hypothetical protein